MIVPLLALRSSVLIGRELGRVVVDNGLVRVAVDRQTGSLDLAWGGAATVHAATGEARLVDGRTCKTRDYAWHDADVRRVKDSFGTGVRITVRHRDKGRPELRHILWVYENRPEAIIRLDALGTSGAQGLVPVSTDVPMGIAGRLRSLFVPYDNDAYVHYRGDVEGQLSYEVSARYDNETRRGLVVGSIDHDLWKTGVNLGAGLRVLAGEAGPGTRDGERHGTVVGREIRSPRISLGFYADWRDGLERYGDLNALVHPPLPWSGGVPFGWNSWAAHKDKVTAANAGAATDAVAALTSFRNGGTATVNFDSYWDNLKPDGLRAFAARAHAAGLKAGIYWTPFVAWGGLGDKVAGDERRTYGDLALRGAAGQPLPRLDGGAPLDPTHPGTLARIDRQLKTFVEQGFDFVKLDFLTHGALEGRHFDPRINTGTAAYAKGMKRIVDDLSPRKIGRPFFISLSIAPLFPSGFAHSRRISCDVFANIGATEYLMNSANYAWWEAGRLYAFNDPDHSVVYRSLGDQPTTEEEGRTRFTASVISGGMLLDSDDLGDPAALDRFRRLFSNPDVLDVARSGRPYRPVEGDIVEGGGKDFVRVDGDATLVAVFNYNRTKSESRAIPLSRLGLVGEWSVRDMWTGVRRSAKGDLSFELPPMGCALFRLTKG